MDTLPGFRVRAREAQNRQLISHYSHPENLKNNQQSILTILVKFDQKAPLEQVLQGGYLRKLLKLQGFNTCFDRQLNVLGKQVIKYLLTPGAGTVLNYPDTKNFLVKSNKIFHTRHFLLETMLQANAKQGCFQFGLWMGCTVVKLQTTGTDGSNSIKKGAF